MVTTKSMTELSAQRVVAGAANGHLQSSIVTALRRVLGEARKPLALHEPEFASREWEYVKECLDTGWVSSVGSYVDRIERDIAGFTGCRHAIATSNGTSALHICLLLAGVDAGDEVLVPTLTFVATANAVSYLRAVPHFVDCETASLGIDAANLDAYLRETAQIVDGVCTNRVTGAPIKALVAMHVFGHPCEVEALAGLARRWNLVLIEDAAESLGSYYRGRHTGNFGRVAALSFNGNKIVTTGGGGAVLTNDAELARRAKHLTTTARVSDRWNFVHDEIGYNYRMPNINAALGCAQLEQLGDFLRAKRALFERYRSAFAAVPNARMLAEPEGCRSNYWLQALLLDESISGQRDELLAATNAVGFQTRPAWMPMHTLAPYDSCPRASLHVVESLQRRIINVPSSAALAWET